MAKNVLILPAAATLFLLLVSLSPTQATAVKDSNVVLDSEGNPVEVGSEYFIQPVGVGFRGGLRKSSRNGAPIGCPLYIIESPFEVDRGEAFKFVPEDENESQILVSSGVKVDSGFSAYCRDDGIWRLTFDPFNRRSVVVASGNSLIPRSTFTLEKSDISYVDAYKFGVSSSTDSYLTVFRDFRTGLKLLGLTSDSDNDEPLEVMFVKKGADITLPHKSAY